MTTLGVVLLSLAVIAVLWWLAGRWEWEDEPADDP